MTHKTKIPVKNVTLMGLQGRGQRREREATSFHLHTSHTHRVFHPEEELGPSGHFLHKEGKKDHIRNMRDGDTVTEGPHAQHSDPQRGGALLRDRDTGPMPWHRKKPCFKVTIKENSQLTPLTHLLTGRGAAGTPPG